jgi:hypothetical protein
MISNPFNVYNQFQIIAAGERMLKTEGLFNIEEPKEQLFTKKQLIKEKKHAYMLGSMTKYSNVMEFSNRGVKTEGFFLGATNKSDFATFLSKDSKFKEYYGKKILKLYDYDDPEFKKKPMSTITGNSLSKKTANFKDDSKIKFLTPDRDVVTLFFKKKQPETAFFDKKLIFGDLDK